MNELQEEINKFGGWENYYQFLLTTYGDTKQQKEDFVKRTYTSEIQSYKGKQNTSEQQAIKGRLGGRNNTSEQQSLKGKNNTSEQQRVKALKSAKVRYENSNEKNKPWETLGISRGWYYTQKRLGNIE